MAIEHPLLWKYMEMVWNDGGLIVTVHRGTNAWASDIERVYIYIYIYNYYIYIYTVVFAVVVVKIVVKLVVVVHTWCPPLGLFYVNICQSKKTWRMLWRYVPRYSIFIYANTRNMGPSFTIKHSLCLGWAHHQDPGNCRAARLECFFFVDG